MPSDVDTLESDDAILDVGPTVSALFGPANASNAKSNEIGHNSELCGSKSSKVGQCRIVAVRSEPPSTDGSLDDLSSVPEGVDHEAPGSSILDTDYMY